MLNMAAIIAGVSAAAVPIATQCTPHAAATIFIIIPLSAVAVMAIQIIAVVARAVVAVADIAMADAGIDRAGAGPAGFTDAGTESHANCRPRIFPSLRRLGAA